MQQAGGVDHLVIFAARIDLLRAQAAAAQQHRCRQPPVELRQMPQRGADPGAENTKATGWRCSRQLENTAHVVVLLLLFCPDYSIACGICCGGDRPGEARYREKYCHRQARQCPL
ncbi:hypothetical protein GCM10027297_31770 [Parahaliea aestuarii]